jgi:hypothetical protein
VVAIFCGCQKPSKYDYVYPNDPKISDVLGRPHDSTTFSFPEKIRLKDTLISTGIDSSMQRWYGEILWTAKEPVLYNRYLGHDIYRFTWIRSFHLPVVISLHRDGRDVWLNCEILNRTVDTFNTRKVYWPAGSKSKKHNYLTTWDYKEHLQAYKYYNSRKLSIDDWDRFVELVRESNFNNLSPTKASDGEDGSEWIIEEHSKYRYWFVSRWIPKDKFSWLGRRLIRLSGIQEEIY